MTWEEDNAIRLIRYGCFKSLLLTLAQTGKRPEFNVCAQGLGFLFDPTANFVPEGRGAFQGVDGNAELFFLGKESGRHVRAVTHVFRDLEDPHPGHGIYTGMIVQSPVHGARGYS